LLEAGAQMRSHGLSSDSITWEFKSRGSLNIYGLLDAEFTNFEGLQYPGTYDRWDGIIGVYEDALIQLDNCRIKNIFADDTHGGSALHLWESNNANN